MYDDNKLDYYFEELDKIDQEIHPWVLYHVYTVMRNKDKLEAFKRFFQLTDEELEVIEKMWRSGRTLNSGAKDGYEKMQ